MRLGLAKLRKEKGYTQKSFAAELKISKQMLEFVEQGRRFPSESILLKIMEKLGTTDITIFNNVEKTFEKRGDVTKTICNYMNNLTREHKEYTDKIVKAIRSSLMKEWRDRKRNNLNIESYTERGKAEIFQRAATIANEKLNTEITVSDIKLYKRCLRLEYQDRTGKTTWGKPEERRRNGASTRTGKFLDV